MNKFRKIAGYIIGAILMGMLIISFGLWGIGDMLRVGGHNLLPWCDRLRRVAAGSPCQLWAETPADRRGQAPKPAPAVWDEVTRTLSRYAGNYLHNERCGP